MSISPTILCSPHYALSGYVVAMLGQVLTACAQPFLLYAPTKLANLWFGPKERAICTTLASLGNPVGFGMAQLISSHVVTGLDRFSILVRGSIFFLATLGVEGWSHFRGCDGRCRGYLNYICMQHLIYTTPALVGAICTGIAYWRPTPPLPPAPSAHSDHTPFLIGLKRVLTTPSFLLLLLIWGCSSGLFNAMLTLLAQILCPYGYSDVSAPSNAYPLILLVLLVA